MINCKIADKNKILTVNLYFTQVISKRKHNKHIMIESSFELTVSSENKPILIASGHELCFQRKNKFTENWICSKYQTHKSRATAITENNELIDIAPNCRPENFFIDFEQAARQSFQNAFPEAHLSGCFSILPRVT